jgi:hypothetical protein
VSFYSTGSSFTTRNLVKKDCVSEGLASGNFGASPWNIHCPGKSESLFLEFHVGSFSITESSDLIHSAHDFVSLVLIHERMRDAVSIVAGPIVVRELQDSRTSSRGNMISFSLDVCFIILCLVFRKSTREIDGHDRGSWCIGCSISSYPNLYGVPWGRYFCIHYVGHQT